MSNPITVDALFAEALRPEGLSGAAYDSRLDAEWRRMIDAGLHESVGIAREDLVLAGAHDVADSPVTLNGGRPLYGRRNSVFGWRDCRPVMGPEPTGLRAASSLTPLLCLTENTATVFPSVATASDARIATVGPFSTGVGEDHETPGLHPLIAQAALARARVLLVTAALDAASVVASTVGSGPATTTMPVDMDAAEPWDEESNEDPEMVAAAVAAKQATLSHFAALVQEVQGRYQALVGAENASFGRIVESLQATLQAAIAEATHAMALISPAPPPSAR